MHKAPFPLNAFFAGLLVAAMLVGCTRPLAPQTSSPQALETAPVLTGRVLFAAYKTQAEMSEVATSATVSLIESATNVTISSSVTDAGGTFSLNFGNGFKPDKTKAYFLEAVKGLSSGGDPNRAGASLARVRTLIYWRSGQWKSLTRQGVIVNRSTTALSIITNLRAAASLPVSTEELIGSINVGFPDKSVTPALPDTFIPAQTQIANADFQHVHRMVSDALVRDTDPVFAVSLDMGPPLRYVQTTRGFEVAALTPASGLSQDLLTLTGYGFDPVPANNLVRFNGWAGKTESVSADRRTLTVRPPGRLGLTGPTSLQIGSIVKVGPNWTQTGWRDSFDNADNLKGLLNSAISNGALILTASNTLGFTDSTKADFQAGQLGGLIKTINDPIDGGDGALTLAINPLKVLQVHPDGAETVQIAMAQGVYNYRPDLFEIDLLAVTQFNTLTSLDAAFNVTQVAKSGTTAPAVASVGSVVSRTMRYYDILYFGIADGYAGKDLLDVSRDLTRSFAQLGRGVLFSHDTVAGPSWQSKPRFASLSDVHGLGVHDHTQPGFESVSASIVYQVPGIDTTSRILKQPFDVSGVNNFTILPSHSLNQNTDNGATAWYSYDVSTPARARVSPYWTSFTTATSNSAFFSYGHRPEVPAEYEAKAMINSMYYTYDRGTEIRGTYTSKALDSGVGSYAWKDTPFSWVASRPNEYSKVTFQVAATNDPNAATLTYVGPDGTSNTSFSTPGAVLPALTGRYLRYQATLTTNSIASVPVLSRVDVGATFSNATSVVIAPNALQNWGSLSFAPSTPGSQALRLQVLDKDGNVLPEATLAGNTAGFNTSPVDLSLLPANNYPAIRLKIVLLKQGAVVPQIDSLQLTWTP